MGPFYLTLGLVDALREGANEKEEARIVNVSSSTHALTQLEIDDLMLERPGAFTSLRAYSQSKLALVWQFCVHPLCRGAKLPLISVIYQSSQPLLVNLLFKEAELNFSLVSCSSTLLTSQEGSIVNEACSQSAVEIGMPHITTLAQDFVNQMTNHVATANMGPCFLLL